MESISKVDVKPDVKCFFIDEKSTKETFNFKEESLGSSCHKSEHANSFSSVERPLNIHSLLPVSKVETTTNDVTLTDDMKIELDDTSLYSVVEEKPCIAALKALVETYSENQGLEEIGTDGLPVHLPENITHCYISHTNMEGNSSHHLPFVSEMKEEYHCTGEKNRTDNDVADYVNPRDKDNRTTDVHNQHDGNLDVQVGVAQENEHFIGRWNTQERHLDQQTWSCNRLCYSSDEEKLFSWQSDSTDGFGKCQSQTGRMVIADSTFRKVIDGCRELNGKTIVKGNGHKHGRISYVCSVCGEHFRDVSVLSFHEKKHTTNKPYKCSVCSKGFVLECNLLRHQKVLHANKKPFKCNVCGKEFRWKAYFLTHKLLHTGERPYICDMCGEKFIRRQILYLHLKSHMGQPAYKCYVCGEMFVSKSLYSSHEKTHLAEKPFECQVCGKGFGRKSHLTSHKRIHNDERPYPCEVCGKRFRRMDHLSGHKKVHSEGKRYECDMCGGHFRSEPALSYHMNSHREGNVYPNRNSVNKEKPYKCSTCGKGYERKHALTLHEITVHTLV